MTLQIKRNCDICEKVYWLTHKQNYDLEKAGFSIYCQDCADKLNLTKWVALRRGIKIYKMR